MTGASPRPPRADSVRNPILPLLCLLAVGAPTLAQQPVQLDVSTDVFEMTFSAGGGVPVKWRMADVPDPDATGERRYEDLLDPDYAASSAFKPFAVVLDADGEEPIDATDARTYEFAQTPTANGTRVVLTSPVDGNGLQVIKTWELAKASHLFTLRIEIANRGSNAATVAPGITLGPGLGYSPAKKPELFEERFLLPTVLPFLGSGSAVRTLDLPVEAPFAIRAVEEGLSFAGLQTDFTVLAVVPSGGDPLVGVSIHLPSEASLGDLAVDAPLFPCGTLFHAETSIAAGSSATYEYAVYAGPKKRDLLAATSLGLENIPLNYLPGWFAGFCFVVEWVVVALMGVFGSWGLALMVLAVLFRLLVLPLSLWGAKAQVEMKEKMAAIKPRVIEVKAKYAKNAEKRNDAILALYKEHRINPLSNFKGCLPLFIQLPILVALVQVLLNSYDLIDARFLWIEDLTRTDRFMGWGMTLPWLGSYVNLLPLIMFGAMVVVGKIMQSTGSSGGGSVAGLLGMPIGMTILFYPFPAGCMLFWTTGTVLQIAEQKYIASRVAASG